MGKFIDSTSAKHPARRKPLQTCTLSVVIDVDDTSSWDVFISDTCSENFVMTIIRVDKWFAHAEIAYTAHGANRTDITRALIGASELGLNHLPGPTRTERLT